MLVPTLERARELGRDGAVLRLLATGCARVAKGEMPKAPVPAAPAALCAAGVELDTVDAVVTHTPFAVNDLWFARATGRPLDRMNRFGSSRGDPRRSTPRSSP